MKLHEAIAGAEAGEKFTCDLLQRGAVMKTDDQGELRIVFEASGDSYVFTPRAEHHDADWRKVGGWASYG